MTRRNKVKTTMNSVVYNWLAVNSRLGVEELFALEIDIFDNWLPAVRVIDTLAKAGRVYDGKPQIDALLAQENRSGVNAHRLFLALIRAWELIGIVQLGQKERVNKCRLSETSFTFNY